MVALRAERLKEMHDRLAKVHFGKVYEISKNDWDCHVTRAPKDVSVAILLY